MNLGNFTKQPYDVLDYDISFDEFLPAGDTVDANLTTVVPRNATITVDSVFFGARTAKVWVSGGTTGTAYIFDVSLVSADGRKKQYEFRIRAKES